jgi:hypothetical protein
VAEFSADVAEVAQLAAQLHAAADELAALDPANTEAGRVVLQATRPPRRSGALAASLQADATRNGVVFAGGVRYWTFVHWGAPRRNLRARPYFTEALTRTSDELAKVYAAHAERALGKVH